MESLQTCEGHQQMDHRHGTVVQYDLTSSKDELDENESYIYCSATAFSDVSSKLR